MKLCLNCQHTFNTTDWTCPACGFSPASLNGITTHSEKFAYEGGGFKAEYFSELAKLEANNFWFQARNELILWAIKLYSPTGQSLLEVGCGTGFVLSGISQRYPNIALNGSEIFLSGLKHASNRVPSANFMQMDARQIPFVNEYDIIGAFDVLEHIKEDEETLTQLHKALNKNGILLLTVPQHPWLWSATDDYACHVRRYTAADIHEKVCSAGFTIKRSTSFVSLLLPAMLISRTKKKKISTKQDATTDLRLPPFLNKTFLKMMQLEEKLIRAGINFPLGGSRLIIARKAS